MVFEGGVSFVSNKSNEVMKKFSNAPGQQIRYIEVSLVGKISLNIIYILPL